MKSNRFRARCGKYYKYITFALGGISYGIILLCLSRYLIFNIESIFKIIANMIGLSEKEILEICTILTQFKKAEVVSPYIPVILISAVLVVLYAFLIRKSKRKKTITTCVWTILFLPLLLVMIMFSEINGIRISASVLKTTEKVEIQKEEYESTGENWYAGFGRRQIIPDENTDEPLYIAGYNNGVEVTGVLDYCEAKAVWVDTGDKGVLVIGVDCIALDSSIVNKIRETLADIPDCVAINVYSTHTHASVDTLGMWGPVGVDGKNDAYMDALIKAAAEAGKEAYSNRVKGDLYFGYAITENMYRDSRDPQVYDENLYQLRFVSENGADNIRFLFYGAHPEALRGNNTLLSRDYAGALCDGVSEKTGDNAIFAPGALGGLIMTKEFHETDTAEGAVANLETTSEKLVEYALSISEEMEKELLPEMAFKNSNCVIPMDNTAFGLYKLLGILNNKAVRADSATGYGVETEVAVLQLGDISVALIPGEIFPELVYGGEYGDVSSENENPQPLKQIAKEQGYEDLLIIGLANDEIGYIVAPSDYMVNAEKPYFEKAMDYKGENHYEETNSIGIQSAYIIEKTFKGLLGD